MIKVTEIEGYKYLNANSAKSKMKGNTLRYNFGKGNFLKGTSQIENNDLAIIQTKTSLREQANSLQREEAQVIYNKSGKIEHKISKTIPINIHKQREFACLSPRPTTPVMAKQYTKALSESEHKLKQRPSTITTKEIQRYLQKQDKSIRLSLSHFQEKMRSISIDKKIERGEKIQDKAITLKLEGINCKITKNNKIKKNVHNLDLSMLFEKQSAIYLTQHQNNLPSSIQPQKILSKIETQGYKPLSEFNSHSRQFLHSRKHITSAMSKRTIGSRNIQSARSRAKVNIINMIDGAPLQKKRKSNQIFAQFCKSDETISPKNNQSKGKPQNIIIKIELYEQLNQIKKQIDNRKATNRHMLPRQKQIKYTTNLIEERLNKRKSLMKNYTFKKMPSQPKAKCVPVDDFHVQGWNNHQTEHKEAIVN